MKTLLRTRSITLFIFFSFQFLSPHLTMADTSAGTVVTGNATGLSGDGLTYNAAGNQANVLSYGTFNVNANQAFNALNPNAAGSNLGIFVNGGLPTTIAGQFNAPGFNTVLVNNSGLVASNGASFNVASFAATTRGVDLASLQNWSNGNQLALGDYSSSGNLIKDNTGLLLDAALNIANPSVMQGEVMYLSQLPPGVTVSSGNSAVISADLASNAPSSSPAPATTANAPVADTSAASVASVPQASPTAGASDSGVIFGTAPSASLPSNADSSSAALSPVPMITPELAPSVSPAPTAAPEVLPPASSEAPELAPSVLPPAPAAMPPKDNQPIGPAAQEKKDKVPSPVIDTKN